MNGLVKKMPALLTSASIDLKAGQRRLDDLGRSCRLADVAVYQSDAVGSRDLGRLSHLPGIGNDIEAPFDKRLHESRADSLRSCRSQLLSSVGCSWFSSSRIVFLADQKSASNTMRYRALPDCKPGEGLVDIAHRKVLGLRRDFVS